MNLVEYQKWVESTSTPRVNQMGLAYASLGLAGESGEVIEKVKKILRDERMPTEDEKDYLLLELGDVLWYIAKHANILGLDLQEILEANVAKINDRKEHGKKHFANSP